MKLFKIFLLSLMCLLATTIESRADFFSDVIVTGANSIWTDSRAYSTLNAAITAVGANERTIVVSRPQVVTALTVPSNVTLAFIRDGSITNSGQLTIQTKNIIAANRQIFTGSGNIDFAAGTELKTGWFSNIETAFALTSNDTVTLVISKAQTITASFSPGNDVHLKWDGPGNILTVNGGVVVGNLKNIEAGNYQILAGAGDIDFLDGAELKLIWFNHLRTVLTWIESETVRLHVTRAASVDFSCTVPTNVELIIDKFAPLTITAGQTLTIHGAINAGIYQIFAGTGTVAFDGIVDRIYPQWIGALADGSHDDSDAINWAALSAYSANKQTGSSFRSTVFFISGAYVCKKTLILYPFVNYIGTRASVSDSADLITYTAGSGTVIRQHPDLYNNDNASAGVLVYIQTGDMLIENMTFVGTGAINANPSVGVQFGYGSGTRTHETANQVVSGLNLNNVSFFAFLTAWEIYNINDSRVYNARFESNTIGVNIIGKAPGTYMGDLEIYASVFYASVYGLYIGDYANIGLTVVSSLFQGSAALAQNHIAKIAGTFPQTVSGKSPTYRFIGTNFKHVHANSKHINLDAIWDGWEGLFQFEGCSFEDANVATGGILLQRNGGTANANGVYFTDSWFKNTSNVLNIANGIAYRDNVFDNSYITAATTVALEVRNNIFKRASGLAVTAISSTTSNCSDWAIVGNDFSDSTITTKVSIFNHSSNIDILCKDNRGLMGHTSIAAGATTLDTRGKSHIFATTNVAPTTLSAITGAYDGQDIEIVFGDALTTIDFTGTNLYGNGGVDLLGAIFDSIRCRYYKAATFWYCSVQKGTAVPYRSGAGSPVGAVTPLYIGEEYLNTTGFHWWKAVGLADTSWVELN